MNKKKKLRIIIVGVVIPFLLIILTVTSIYTHYNLVVVEHSSIYFNALNNGVTEVNATWLIAKNYKKYFHSTYGEKPSLEKILTQPIKDFSESFWEILCVIRAKGTCEDFAYALAKIVGDTTHHKTRIVYFEGMDHALVEVFIDGKWWVFDPTYTTPKKPIPINDYATQMDRLKLSRYVARILMVDNENRTDLTKEHGFKVSTLTVKAIYDPTAYPFDDAPLEEGEVTVYAPENFYDPLVAKGFTNASGVYSVTLNGDKDYIVFVRGKGGVGVAYQHLPPESYVVLEVRVHKEL